MKIVTGEYPIGECADEIKATLRALEAFVSGCPNQTCGNANINQRLQYAMSIVADGLCFSDASDKTAYGALIALAARAIQSATIIRIRRNNN